MKSITKVVKCDVCGVELKRNVGFEQKNVFCSIACKAKWQRGHKKGPMKQETREKIAKSNSKPHSESRKRAISIARTARYTDQSIIDNILLLLYYPYYSHRMICNFLNLKRDAAYNNTINILIKDYNLFEVESDRLKGYHKQQAIDMFDHKDKIDWLKLNHTKYSLDEICDKLDIKGDLRKNGGFLSYYCKHYFGSFIKPKTYEFHNGPTTPELKVKEFFDTEGIEYEYNKMVKCDSIDSNEYWYSVDFYIPINIFVEVQGDFWHANPMIYKSYDKLHYQQRNNINRDKRKKSQIKSTFKDCVYYTIWEYDIINNTDEFDNFKREIKCTVQKMKSM